MDIEQSSGFYLSHGKLHFDGRPILHDVPSYVNLSSFASLNSSQSPPPLSSASSGGAFIGFNADTATHTHTFSLGKLQNTRFSSIFRFKVWWTTHWVGDSGSNLQKETQMMTLDTHTKAQLDGVSDYPYVVLLPIFEGRFRASLQPGLHDYVDAFVESGSTRVCEKSFESCVYVHACKDPFLLVKDAVKVLQAHLGTFRVLEEKVVPQIVCSFGWCTWDAYYLRTFPDGVWDGIKSLVEGGVPPRFVIIDDGWQSIAWDHQDPSEDATEQVIAGDQMACRLTRVSENLKFSSYIKGSFLQKKSSKESACCNFIVNGVESDIREDGRSKQSDIVRRPSFSDTIRDVARKHLEACDHIHDKSARTSEEEKQGGVARIDVHGCDASVPGSAATVLGSEATVPERASPGLITSPTSADTRKRMGLCLRGACNCPNTSISHVNDGDFDKEAQYKVLPNGPAKNECGLEQHSKGLVALIDDLKTEFPLLEDVYVWQSVVGYWGGVRPGVEDAFGAELVKPVLSPGVLETMPDLAVDRIVRSSTGLVPPVNIFKFYNRLHSYLAENGVSGVKIDVIQVLEMLGENYGGRVELSKAYYKGLAESIRKNLGGNRVIASMEQTNDFMLLGTENVALGRVGDDFWPHDLKGDPLLWLQWFHVVHCAYNSLWLGQFIRPDWDMFQTTHLCAYFHAASRALSGGPVYISDKPGHHDFCLLKRLVFPDGTVPCCERFALPTRDCLFADPMTDGVTVLKIWNLTKVAGVVGIFNCQGGGWSPEKRMTAPSAMPPTTCYTRVSPRDVEWPDMHDESESFAIYSLKEDKISILRRNESVLVKVEPSDYDIFTMFALPSLAGTIQFAPFGLVNMLNCAGCIESLSLSARNVMIKLRGVGTFCAYADSEPLNCNLNCSSIDFSYNPLDGRILFKVPWINDVTTVELAF